MGIKSSNLHAVLSAIHTDALVDALVAGDLLIVNATPKWSRLAKGALNTVLKMGAALPAWGNVDFAELTGRPDTYPPYPHAILGTGHSDTLSDQIVRGDLFVVNSTPKWARLAKGAANKILKMGANDPAWGDVDYTELTNVPSTFAPTAHNVLSASHGDALADSVVRGDVIIGNATPKWARLAKGAANTVLKMGANDPAWGSVAWAEVTSKGGVVSAVSAAGGDQSTVNTTWTNSTTTVQLTNVVSTDIIFVFSTTQLWASASGGCSFGVLRGGSLKSGDMYTNATIRIHSTAFAIETGLSGTIDYYAGMKANTGVTCNLSGTMIAALVFRGLAL